MTADLTALLRELMTVRNADQDRLHGMTNKTIYRALLKAKSDGYEFPLYVESEAEAQDAATTLNATVIEVRPSHEQAMQYEQLLTLMFRDALGESHGRR